MINDNTINISTELMSTISPDNNFELSHNIKIKQLPIAEEWYYDICQHFNYAKNNLRYYTRHELLTVFFQLKAMQLNLSGQEVNKQNIHSINIKSSFINIYWFKGNELNKILASKSLKKVNGEICYFIVFLIYFEHLVNCMQKLGCKHEDTNIVISELTALIYCYNCTASFFEVSGPRVDIKVSRDKQLKLSEQKTKENLTFYRIPKLFVIGLLMLNKKPTSLTSITSKNTNKPTIDSKLLNFLSNSQEYLPSNIQHIIENKSVFEPSIIDLSDKTLSKWRTQYRNFKKFITARSTNQNNYQIILEIVNGKSQDTSVKEFHRCLCRKDVLEIASWLLENN